MREIIFRGKRVDNSDWVEGAYYKQDYFYGDEVEKHIIITSSDALTNDFDLDFYEVIPETIGQFTGMTDKNGKRIFEGDIICANTVDTNTSRIATVGFGNFIDANNDDEYLGFYIEFDSIKTTITQLNLEILKNRFEVIGNIHDNGELLTAERSE
jgi:uncharacterized phage protein (TIGR01671 family)